MKLYKNFIISQYSCNNDHDVCTVYNKADDVYVFKFPFVGRPSRLINYTIGLFRQVQNVFVVCMRACVYLLSLTALDLDTSPACKH